MSQITARKHVIRVLVQQVLDMLNYSKTTQDSSLDPALHWLLLGLVAQFYAMS